MASILRGRSRRAIAYGKIATFFIALLLGVSACGPIDQQPSSEDELRSEGLSNLQTVVASDRNYDVYWLGTGFTAGGLDYWGPDVGELGSEIGKVEGGGLGMYYLRPPGTTCCGSLKLVMFSRSAWGLRQQNRSEGARPRFESKMVTINGRTAELRTILNNPDEGIGAQVLIIEFDNTVIEATTGAVIPLTPSATQLNPLMAETTFLAVMQNLRPYPE